MSNTLTNNTAKNAVMETEAQKFFAAANQHFPDQVKKHTDGSWTIEILGNGCELIEKHKTTLKSSKLREPSAFRQTFGRHLPSQKYSGFKTEYPIEYGIKPNEDKRPDFVITFDENDNEKILVFGEIGITTAKDEDALVADFYEKFKENIDRALLPEIINNSEERLDENVTFWTPLYNGSILYSDKASYDAYVDSPKESGFYEIYERTGIASWAISIPRKQLEDWNKIHKGEIPLNELKAYPIDLEKEPSSLYLLNLSGVNVEANQVSPYTKSNFSAHINRAENTFDISRLPFRNNGRGGSHFDNIRGLSTDKVEALEYDILEGIIENLESNDYDFNPNIDDVKHTESRIVGFNNRSVKGSLKNSIVKMNHRKYTNSNAETHTITDVLMLVTDLSVDDSQHSGISLSHIIANIAKKTTTEIADYLVDIGYEKTLTQEHLEVLKSYVEHFNIIVNVSLWDNVKKGSIISKKSQYVEDQSTVARELLEYKEKFKIIASAANEIDQTTHYEVIAAFGQDPKNQINNVISKGIEDSVSFVSGYYRFKDALEKMSFVSEGKELRSKFKQLDDGIKWTEDINLLTVVRAVIKNGTEARKKKQNYDYLYKEYTSSKNQKQVDILTDVINEMNGLVGSHRAQVSAWNKVYKKYNKLKVHTEDITELYMDIDREVNGKRNKDGDIVKKSTISLDNDWCSESMKYILTMTSHLDAERFVRDSHMDTFIKDYHKSVSTIEKKTNAVPIGVYGTILAFYDYYNNTSIFEEEESYVMNVMDKINKNLHKNSLDIESLKRDLVKSKIEKSFVDSLFSIFSDIVDFDKLFEDKSDDFERLENSILSSIKKDIKREEDKKKKTVSAQTDKVTPIKSIEKTE